MKTKRVRSLHGALYVRRGLYGALRYMFKGLDPDVCRQYRIKYKSQGPVRGKRFGRAEILSAKRAGPPFRIRGVEYPVRVAGLDVRTRRMMSYIRFNPDERLLEGDRDDEDETRGGHLDGWDDEESF